MPSSAASHADRFCAALLGSVPPEMTSLLWTLADKHSHWVPLSEGPEAVAKQAVELGTSSDVYVAVSVTAQSRMGQYQRITSDNSAGIMALWADIDIADPDVHKKWNLPPDEDGARDLLTRAGLEPSLLVHSGHGLQAWWVFNEFWGFETEEDRLAAAELAQRWNTTLRVRAAERQWTVDSTFDLARVMRIPGTSNRKGAKPIRVQLLDDTGKRYNPEDFDGYIVDESLTRGLNSDRTYVVDSGIMLGPDRWPPGDKLDALIEGDPTFAASWNRRRRDLVDQSPSTYDMSLASMAAMAGWTDQEIADLILAGRKKHRDDVSKALRPDYIARTISRARDVHARERASEAVEDAIDELKEARASGDDEEVRTSRRQVLDSIGQQLEIEVVHFIKYTSDPPAYRMVTPTAGVDLGGASGILMWSQFREAVAGATGHMIPRFRNPAWDRLAQAIFDACEDQDVGLESTERGQVQVWLSEYLMSRPPVDSVQEAGETEYPFRDGEGTHFFASSLRKWLWLSRSEHITQRQLGRMLRQYGLIPGHIAFLVEGTRTRRAIWTIPTGGRA